jgi:hypothetical protein
MAVRIVLGHRAPHRQRLAGIGSGDPRGPVDHEDNALCARIPPVVPGVAAGGALTDSRLGSTSPRCRTWSRNRGYFGRRPEAIVPGSVRVISEKLHRWGPRRAPEVTHEESSITRSPALAVGARPAAEGPWRFSKNRVPRI